MKIKTINLAPSLYHDYVEGRKVMCNSKSLEPGQHVMVFKDTVSATSSVPVPHSSQHADSIGVEGVVISIQHDAGAASTTIKKI